MLSLPSMLRKREREERDEMLVCGSRWHGWHDACCDGQNIHDLSWSSFLLCCSLSQILVFHLLFSLHSFLFLELNLILPINPKTCNLDISNYIDCKMDPLLIKSCLSSWKHIKESISSWEKNIATVVYVSIYFCIILMSEISLT